MHKTYSVTKKQIIEAVLTEPLIANQFVDFLTSKNEKCSVCAVGAVLRKAGLNNNQIFENAAKITKYDFCERSFMEGKDLDTDNFLSILSMHHEYFAQYVNQSFYRDPEAMDLQRMHLLNVIEAFCPEVVTFMIEEKNV